MPKGNQVSTLKELRRVAERRLSVVYHPTRNGPNIRVPAAVAINYSGFLLLRYFHYGMWIYVPDRENRCPECAGEVSNHQCLECGWTSPDYDPTPYEADYGTSNDERQEALYRHRREIGR